MRISIIVATDSKRGIGKNNGLLWNIPDDLSHFRKLTTGHTIIMGRKTFESIGRVLPNRTNVIITRDENFKVDQAVIVHSLDEALDKAKEVEKKEIFIVGGGQIYKQAMESGVVDKLYITMVEGDFGAEIFFPDYSRFHKTFESQVYEYKDIKYRFVEMKKEDAEINSA
ncbi:MAG: dihydrofolate reductase [Candidatus Levybacteria bacterium]|nr:dihydrofolate reductase [Candidatus Levybacteria bacterium]